MPYRHRVPYRVPEVDVDEGYYEPPVSNIGNRSTLLLFLILLLAIGWFLFNQNGSFRSIGAGWGARPVDWSTSDRPVSIEEPAIRAQAPDEQPRIQRPAVSVTPRPREAVIVSEPREREIKREVFKPAVGYWHDPNVVAYAWVTAGEVHLRKGPGPDYDAFYVLPENWPVAILNEADVDKDGEVWTHVRVETKQGTKKGWLNRRYLSY